MNKRKRARKAVKALFDSDDVRICYELTFLKNILGGASSSAKKLRYKVHKACQPTPIQAKARHFQGARSRHSRNGTKIPRRWKGEPARPEIHSGIWRRNDIEGPSFFTRFISGRYQFFIFPFLPFYIYPFSISRFSPHFRLRILHLFLIFLTIPVFLSLENAFTIIFVNTTITFSVSEWLPLGDCKKNWLIFKSPTNPKFFKSKISALQMTRFWSGTGPSFRRK